jgi:hypothetical protein
VFVALSRGIAAAAVTGAAAVLLGGCGGSDAGPSAASSSAAAFAATVRTANCTDWRAASTGDRAALVAGMREFFSGQVDTPGLHGTALPDARAIQLFNNYCAQSYASAFTLYRLYGNAAAFTKPEK